MQIERTNGRRSILGVVGRRASAVTLGFLSLEEGKGLMC